MGLGVCCDTAEKCPRNCGEEGLNQLCTVRQGTYEERTSLILSAHDQSSVKHICKQECEFTIFLEQSGNKTPQFVFIIKMWVRMVMQNAEFSSCRSQVSAYGI
jgi:hypothetical protein